MARKKKAEKKEDLSLKTKSTNDKLEDPTPATGKNKIVTTGKTISDSGDIRRPKQPKTSKKYKPGDDTILKMGRGEKPRKWKSKK